MASQTTSNQAMVQSATNTFHGFKKLAAEIRCKIWGIAQPKGRLIDINISSDRSWITKAPSPALLHVSFESREFMLKTYKPCFTTSQFPQGILVNPSIDMVFLRKDRSNCEAYTNPPDPDRCVACVKSATNKLCSKCLPEWAQPILRRYGNTSLIQNIVISDWQYTMSGSSDLLLSSVEPATLFDNIREIFLLFPDLKRVLLSTHYSRAEFFRMNGSTDPDEENEWLDFERNRFQATAKYSTENLPNPSAPFDLAKFQMPTVVGYWDGKPDSLPLMEYGALLERLEKEITDLATELDEVLPAAGNSTRPGDDFHLTLDHGIRTGCFSKDEAVKAQVVASFPVPIVTLQTLSWSLLSGD